MISTDKNILFINQSPNRMLNDIALVYKSEGWNTTLLCGELPPAIDGFSELVQRTAYNRHGIKNRISTWYKFTTEAKVFAKEYTGRFSRILLVSNPPSLLYLTSFFKKYNREAEIELLIYDLYPDILTSYAGEIVSPLLFPLRHLNRKKISLASKVFTPSQSLSKAVGRYFSGEIRTIYNWVDVTQYKPVEKLDNQFLQKNGIHESFSILYSGNLGKTHDIDTIYNASSKLNSDDKCFLFIGHGEGMQRLKTKVKNNSHFYFFGWQPEELFIHSIASGDVAIVSYLPGAEGYSIPSKLPYYFATGTPVIMIGNPDSELGRLISENKLGWCIKNGDAAALADLLNSLTYELIQPYRVSVMQFVAASWSVLNASKFYHP
jgi:glycosyltransferase involved in cell wall biosynthesis